MYIASLTQLKPTFRALYNQAEIMLNAGKQVLIELSEKKHKRTVEQNNYYWLFCEELAKFLQEHEIYHEYEVCGVKIKKHFTKDSVHLDLCKPLFGVKTTTTMSISEFCDYMNKLLIYWQEQTTGEFQMSELPANYLERKGYQ